jgi:hypothetical protein
MPGLMNGSKKARQTASIINFRQVGVKSGLAPKTNGPAVMFRAYNIGGAQQKPTVPPSVKGYAAQLQYLRDNKLVSVNPASSGGVGRMFSRMHLIH